MVLKIKQRVVKGPYQALLLVPNQKDLQTGVNLFVSQLPQSTARLVFPLRYFCNYYHSNIYYHLMTLHKTHSQLQLKFTFPGEEEKVLRQLNFAKNGKIKLFFVFVFRVKKQAIQGKKKKLCGKKSISNLAILTNQNPGLTIFFYSHFKTESFSFD